MLVKAIEMTDCFKKYNQENTKESYAIALDSMLSLIKALNMKILFPVVSDLSQNIKKIRSTNKETQLIGIQWGTYTVQFFTQFLCLIVNDKMEPSAAGNVAYYDVLHKHYNIAQKIMFHGILKMMPTKQDFCNQIKVTINEDVEKIFANFSTCSQQATGNIMC